ncbi:cyanate transporter [Acinetobacter colistiniresistens]|uniref:CynX/NimT family MFS transporter n=1 Tax=Acinetobacter colistiniresistens TaxID=280145 RepID=S3TET9_9GAMM|nr:cyanate transporter [Acinetobacter colistiniresistens]EPG38209.1 MFS transporter, CP family, cyanate transporter [Acinetobacter colistiniresistens]TVT86272.1 CynX/NimT family MFS transporter [Acinetobacter colistiniresistens]
MNRINQRSFLILTVALVGLNLRPFMTSIGPVANQIRTTTGLSLQGIALLTLVPMLLMGLIAFIGPAIQSAIGERRAILGALGLICLGCGLRFIVPNGWALIGTAAIIGFGVAVVQAAFPSLIKREFHAHLSPMMGLYSAMLMGGGALGAVIAPVVTNTSADWKIGLAIFALPALLAFAFASCFLTKAAQQQKKKPSVSALLKQPRTWLLISCFGLINGGYSSIVAWLAPAFQAQGWTATASGKLMAVLTLSQAAAALLLPYLSRNNQDRRIWIAITLILQLIGFSGLAFFADALPYLWAITVGAGLGGCFALLMIVVLDHLADPMHAGQLSALMQGGGFLLAALAPWWVAVLHGMTGTYAAGWIWHLTMVVIVAGLMIRLDPRHYENVIRF